MGVIVYQFEMFCRPQTRPQENEGNALIPLQHVTQLWNCVNSVKLILLLPCAFAVKMTVFGSFKMKQMVFQKEENLNKTSRPKSTIMDLIKTLAPNTPEWTGWA